MVATFDSSSMVVVSSPSLLVMSHDAMEGFAKMCRRNGLLSVLRKKTVSVKSVETELNLGKLSAFSKGR